MVWGGLLTFMFTCSRGGCCVADISCGVGWGGLIAFICTSTHTLDKNGSLYDPAGTES